MERFTSRGVALAAGLALYGVLVTACSSPPPLAQAKVTLPAPHSASPAGGNLTPQPAQGSFTTPPAAGNFTPDPGIVLMGNSILPSSVNPSVVFECCLGHQWSSAAADPQTWSPGQQIQISWVESARPAAGSVEDTMFLTAKMYGPWATVDELRTQFQSSSFDPVAVAAVVQWSAEDAGTATSVITIPADAAPGYYDLQLSAAAQEVGACGTAACAPGFYVAAIIQVS